MVTPTSRALVEVGFHISIFRRARRKDGTIDLTRPTDLNLLSLDSSSQGRTSASSKESSSARALVRAIGKWRPLKTPRTTLTLFLYVIGMYVAFYAAPLVETTPKRLARYEEALRRVDEEFGDGFRGAMSEYTDADRDLARLTPFGWRFTSGPQHKERVAAAKRRLRVSSKRLAAEEKKRDEAMREARSELGLWSELGVGDAKALFKRSYERGKVFATRHTFWDGLSLILRGKSDESTLSFLFRWLMIALSNFTMGMLTAVFSFAFTLPSLIRSFSTSIWSATAFYCIALVACVSVVSSILFAAYGTAAATTYAVVKYAGPALARLDDADARRRARIGQRPGYNAYPGPRRQRFHQD